MIFLWEFFFYVVLEEFPILRFAGILFFAGVFFFPTDISVLWGGYTVEVILTHCVLFASYRQARLLSEL